MWLGNYCDLIALKKKYISNMHKPLSSEHIFMQIKYS